MIFYSDFMLLHVNATNCDVLAVIGKRDIIEDDDLHPDCKYAARFEVLPKDTSDGSNWKSGVSYFVNNPTKEELEHAARPFVESLRAKGIVYPFIGLAEYTCVIS